MQVRLQVFQNRKRLACHAGPDLWLGCGCFAEVNEVNRARRSLPVKIEGAEMFKLSFDSHKELNRQGLRV